MIELRDYQLDISKKTVNLLNTKKIAYLAMEVRTGKTITALYAAQIYGSRKVLFLTKLRAITSIMSDYSAINCTFEIKVINNESMHKITDNDFDLLISDEHHRNSSFPKPNKGTKEIKQRFGHLPMIFLSGTPAIESGSQWYHSFWISNNSPFKYYTNFYKWAKDFVIPKIRFLGSIQVPDYSQSIDSKILPIIEPYLFKYTQKEAGFTAEIDQHILYCKMNSITSFLIDKLLKDNVVVGNNDTILGDTAVKLMSKIHQVENGTAIFESGNSAILDFSKAIFIREKFKGKKIAIFYYFQKELEILKYIFGENLCTDLETFDTTNKHIALQQVSGSEGISLKVGDCLVYYNWGYSGKNFTQGRDRMTTIDRADNNVYFVMIKGGINEKIYKSISKKKRYNEKLFIKDYGIRKLNTIEN